jgi:CheY-like chemotaxis protein/nitrogen-specific signal transduction histidine kinase
VIRDPKGMPLRMLGVAMDVTDRIRIEQELREADRRKDTFLATLAHELRNPLAPMGYALQIMELAEGDRQAIRNSRATLERQLGHLVRLVDDLLDVSRITQDKIRLQKDRVDLDSIFQQAIEATGPLLSDSGHTLEVRQPEEPVYLYADSTRLAQVFSNLLNNSSKFTNAGGHICISAEREGDEVVVSIRDNGIGISAEALPTVFDMFAQADQSIGHSQAGLGIGLTLAKRLVELHEGSISVTSEGLGKGSEFQVRLPMLIESEESKATSDPGRSGGAGPDSRRILVVDDNQDAARLLSKMLEMLGHETRLAFDGPTALSTADEYVPDIVMMDIGLPGMSGHEVAEAMRLRPWGRTVTLIAITGWGQAEDRAMSKQAGFDHHLVKPVAFDTLSELLTRRVVAPV